MNLVLALFALDIALGGFSLFAVYRWLPGGFGRAFAASAILALFFSLSFVVWRIVVLPLPTFVVLAGVAVEEHEAASRPCVQTPDGCVPAGGEPASFVVLVPLLIQWAFWVFFAARVERRLRIRRRKAMTWRQRKAVH